MGAYCQTGSRVVLCIVLIVQVLQPEHELKFVLIARIWLVVMSV